MKRAVSVLLLLGVFLSLLTASAFAEGQLLGGSFGELEPICNGLSSPFYLDKDVVNCRALDLRLAVDKYTGDPFGGWLLYAMDLKGNWEKIAGLKLEKDLADGHVERYRFRFDEGVSFRALALCVGEEGSAFSLNWRMEFSLLEGELRDPVRPTPTPEEWGLPVEGRWGGTAPIRGRVYETFVLDRALRYCQELTMALTLGDYTGYPFGDWYLYAMDLDDNWQHIAAFRIEKEQADGELHAYEFRFQPPESFQALALCIEDKGAVFTLDREVEFFAP